MKNIYNISLITGMTEARSLMEASTLSQHKTDELDFPTALRAGKHWWLDKINKRSILLNNYGYNNKFLTITMVKADML